MALGRARECSQVLVPCLTYHRLHLGRGPSEPGLAGLSIDAVRFGEHLAALREAGYTGGTLPDLLAWPRSEGEPPARPLLITFDDGWASNLLLAQPALARAGLRATVFVTVDPHAPVFGEGGTLDRRLADAEIADLARAGISIQSHTVTHPPLTEIGRDQLVWELTTSKQRLESLLAGPVTWLACPYGLASSRVVHLARAAGYLGLASGAAGVSSLGGDPMRLRRIGVHSSWSGEDLLLHLAPASLRRAAITSGVKRAVRRVLGHRRSSRLRAALKWGGAVCSGR